MIPLVSREEARAIDARAIAAGVPGLVLMENAGRGATDVLVERMPERCVSGAARPLVVGGLGQNGGDAWVVARQLMIRGIAPVVIVVGDPAKVAGDARTNLDALRGLGASITAIDEGSSDLAPFLARASVIVDGLFGTGLDRAIDGFRAEVIRALAASGVPSLALDLPSGLDADTGRALGVVLPAVVTATFAAHKRGLHQHPGVDLAGEVVRVHIGVPGPPPSGSSGPARAGLLERGDLARLVPARPRDAHKGTAGHVVVLAGSPGRTGAALLAGLGAIRGGAGLVTLAPRGPARAALDAKVIELMTSEIPEALEAGVAAALRECESRSAAVIGPGLGLDRIARGYAGRIAVECPIPAVLDADALTALASDPATLRGARAARVLTPHPGEAARLLGSTSAEIQSDRFAAASALASRTGQVVVLKGARTIVARPDGFAAVCTAGTPALGVAGTGDVLGGCIAAMLASIDDAFDAACAGVLMHALAGEIAARSDRGLLASEVAAALPFALASVRPEATAR